MASVGIVLLWAGYSVLVHGLNQLQGGNDRFLDLIWPGNFNPASRPAYDGGSKPAATPSTSAQAPGTGRGGAQAPPKANRPLPVK